MKHDARQYSDQMHCHICGKQWDVNDPQPPECVKENEERQHKGRQLFEKVRRQLRGG